MKKTLLLGNQGQIGWDLHHLLGKDVVALDRSQLDLQDLDAVKKCIQEVKPEIILNAASINFMAFARLYGDATGQVFSILVVALLALELLVALVIIAAVCSRWKCATRDYGTDLPSQVDY